MFAVISEIRQFFRGHRRTGHPDGASRDAEFRPEPTSAARTSRRAGSCGRGAAHSSDAAALAAR